MYTMRSVFVYMEGKMKRRVLAAFLTAAVAVETIGMPLCTMASEISGDPASAVEESAESSGSVTEESESSVVSEVKELSALDEISSAVVSDVEPETKSEAAEILPETPAQEETEDSTVPEADKTEPVLLEEHMLYAHTDAEKKNILVKFGAFAEAKEYTYEICDSEGNILKKDTLNVEKTDVKGDLEKVFEETDTYEGSIQTEDTWPDEVQLRVYDKAATSYIMCGLKQEEPVLNAAASEISADQKVEVVWTNEKECDGYVVELLNNNDQLLDSQTMENASACTFAVTESDLHVQITPYTQAENAEPVYYTGIATAVAPMAAAAEESVATQAADAPVAVQTLAVPGGIGSVSATAGDQQVTLNWSPAENAAAYRIYIRNLSTGAMEYLTTVDTTYCTVNNLRSGVSYWFEIEAVDTAQNTGARSYAVEATPYMTAPEAPTGLAGNNANGATTLTWYPSSIASGYAVYSYDYSKNRYVEIGRTTATSFTDQGAGATDKHKYQVYAYRTEDNVNFLYSATGPEVLVYGAKTVSTAQSVRPIYYSAKITRKTGLYGKFRKDDTKQGTIKPGKKVTIIYRRWKQSLVSYAGKKYYIYNGAMRVNGQSYTSNDYSTQAKEYFVNSKGYKSKSKYLIWISTYTQRVNVFQGSKGNWKLIRSEKCVTGKMSTYTPLGKFDVTKKKYAHYYGRNFYKYLTYFRGNNKMHTRPARRKGGKYLNATMGKPLSNGCVRLTDSLAKWVYNNVPKKATVLVY